MVSSEAGASGELGTVPTFASHAEGSWLKVVVPFIMLLLVAGTIRSIVDGASRHDLSEAEANESIEFLVDLNQATAEELSLLPGIGPQLAARIIERREKVGAYRSAEELLQVPGIGPLRLAQMQELIFAPGTLSSQPPESGLPSEEPVSGEL